METTRLKDLYLCLKSQGFDVYFTGQHKGNCTKPYVVIKQGVSTNYLGLSTNVDYYDILCYVPKDTPTKLQEYIQEVERALLQISPMIKSTNEISAPFFDDTVQGWMSDITCRGFRKIYSDVFKQSFNKEE